MAERDSSTRQESDGHGGSTHASARSAQILVGDTLRKRRQSRGPTSRLSVAQRNPFGPGLQPLHHVGASACQLQPSGEGRAGLLQRAAASETWLLGRPADSRRALGHHGPRLSSGGRTAGRPIAVFLEDPAQVRPAKAKAREERHRASSYGHTSVNGLPPTRLRRRLSLH